MLFRRRSHHTSVMANQLASLSNEIAAAVALAARNVVAVHARPRFSSSGVFWRPGVIVTAEHPIRREEEITVTLPDGTNVPATLAGTDPGTDIAVLKIASVTQTPGIATATAAPAPGTLGVIVTAEHTIRREEEIAVTLPDGTNV